MPKTEYDDLYYARAELKRYGQFLRGRIDGILNDAAQGAQVSHGSLEAEIGGDMARFMLALGEVRLLERRKKQKPTE